MLTPHLVYIPASIPLAAVRFLNKRPNYCNAPASVPTTQTTYASVTSTCYVHITVPFEFGHIRSFHARTHAEAHTQRHAHPGPPTRTGSQKGKFLKLFACNETAFYHLISFGSFINCCLSFTACSICFTKGQCHLLILLSTRSIHS